MSAEISAGTTVVEASGLEAVFPTGDGVGPVDLHLEPGQSVLVLGPSGSGKSTLLRMLHGAVPHAVHAQVSGKVWVKGRPLASTRIADLADTVGVVAQDPESGVCLSHVADEVALPLENLALDPEKIGPAVELALARAGAADLRDRGTGELSGGELQRVALAAAIAPTPGLLLLDEPTAMLDAEGIDAVRGAIDIAQRATGAAYVLVEHRLDELAGDDGVAGLPERWIVLGRDGRVHCETNAHDLSRGVLRDLVGLGCWLPFDLELRAVLGEGDAEFGNGDADDAGQVVDGERVVAVLRALLPGNGAESRATVAPVTADHTVPSQTAHAALSARNLTVARGRRARSRTVLRGVNVELRPGTITALVGANGSGKSSLLTCLAGLEQPTEGEVCGPRAGLVFQNPEHQFVARTVREEIAHGLSRPQQDLIDPMLDRFDLTELAEHNPYRLSGGQKRRVSLAAMLVHEHPFLLADEPTFGLDRHAAIMTMRTLGDTVRQKRGVGFSSHDLRAVATYADRVLVLGGGRLLADTTPVGLLQDPALLAGARLRPSLMLRTLAAEVGDDAALRTVLHSLDDRALALMRRAPR